MKILLQDYGINDCIAMGGSIFRTLSSPAKVLNLIKIKISTLFRLERSLGFPINILIEPTRNCNYACPQCPRQGFSEMKSLDKMELSLGEFKHIMAQIGKYILTVRLWHFGEPLLNKDLPAIVKVAKQYRIFTATSSNCSLLNKELSGELIDAGLDYLLVSINAATAVTYRELTLTDNFQKVKDNLKYFQELKRERKSRRPFLNLQFIVMKNNFAEIAQMKKLSEYIGANKLSFKHIAFKREELGVEDGKYKFCVENAGFCSLPFEESVISANGEVTPCAPDYRNQYSMGNIFKNDYRIIWNNEKYRNFRKSVKEDLDGIDICQNCPKKNNPDFFIKI